MRSIFTKLCIGIGIAVFISVFVSCPGSAQEIKGPIKIIALYPARGEFGYCGPPHCG